MTAHTSVAVGIDRALIPAAGFGTRLRPLTNAIPKEMLPIGRKPVLEHIVDEMLAIGITRLLFVISPGKEMIRHYFGDGSKWGVQCDYVVQTEMKGLGDAILRGETWAEGRPILVAFGDCIIEAAGAPPSARLLETFSVHNASAVVLTERIALEKTRKYGIVAPVGDLPDTPTEPFALRGIVEKPAPEDAPSTLAVAARWALSTEIFDCLRAATPGPDGELNLTDTVRAMIDAGRIAWSVPLRHGEARRDIGGWETYLVAAARAAASDPEFGDKVRTAISAEISSF